MKQEYEFSAQVSDLDLDNEIQLSRLKNDLFTVTPFLSECLTMLGVEITADSADSAVHLFEAFLTSAAPEIKITRLDLDLVSLSQISERLDITREAVRLWATGERRKDFPRPFTSAGQSLLWAWSDVYEWLTPKEVGDFPRPLPTNLIERSNGKYARERLTSGLGWQERSTQRTQTYLGQLDKSFRSSQINPPHEKMKYGRTLSATLDEEVAM